LELIDFACQDLDPYDNIHHADPENFLIQKQEKESLEKYKNLFNIFNKKEKIQIIGTFLENNRNNPEMKAEIKAAKRLLENGLTVI
jgi:hypothetical protein